MCKDCKELDMVTVVTMDIGRCRNCGILLKG